MYVIVPDPFDSWGEYRSFVADSQRSLFSELRAQYEAGELDLAEDGSYFTSVSKSLGYGWREPVQEKWHATRAVAPGDHAMVDLYEGATSGTADAIHSVATSLFDPEDDERAIVVYDWFDDDEARLEAYLRSAPAWALLAEAWIDGLAALACAASVSDPDDRGEFYDRVTEPDTELCGIGFAIRSALQRYDRESVVDGSFVPDLFDRLDDLLDRLTALTVWGTKPEGQLAVPDPALEDGYAHPRTWTVEPTQAVDGVPGALTGPADVRATVTVTERQQFDPLLVFEPSGFYRGRVDACDDEFPAEPGETVLVAPANVVGRDFVEPRGSDGLTETQRQTCERVVSSPDSVSTDECDRIATWATTAEPQVRERSVAALGSLARAETYGSRAVDTLVDATADPDEAVRRAAAAELDDTAADRPAAVGEYVDTLIDLLSADAQQIQQHAARCLSALADADPTLLVDHAEPLHERFRQESAKTHFPKNDTVVRDELLAVHKRLTTTDCDVVAAVTEALVERASAGAVDASEALSTVDQDDPEFDAVVTALQDQLAADLEADRRSTRESGASKLEQVANHCPEYLIAADLGDQFVETIRGERKSDDSWAETERQRAVLAAAHLVDDHLDYLVEIGAVDALADCLTDDVWKKVVKTAADTLAAVGVQDPQLVEDIVDDVVGLFDHYKCNVRERGALTLGMFAAAEPDLVESAVPSLVDLATDDDQCKHTIRSAWFALVAASDHLEDDMREQALSYTRSRLQNTTTLSPDIYLTFASVDPSLLDPVADALRSNPDMTFDDVTDLLADDVEQYIDREPGVAYAPLEHPCQPDRIKWVDPIDK